jgi:tRNA(fMet)-specific endonuclease VapC
VSIVSHGELFEGAFNVPHPDTRVRELYVFLSQFRTVYLTDPIMEVFGRTRYELRRTGRRIEDFDLLIGATAVYLDLIVLTRNVRHFERIPGIRLYQPT